MAADLDDARLAKRAEAVLRPRGFARSAQRRGALQAHAEAADTDGGSLTANGPYVVAGVWTRDDVAVHVEQNVAPDEIAPGLRAVVTHPPVAVIVTPNGRVATPLDALNAVLDDVLRALG